MSTTVHTKVPKRRPVVAQRHERRSDRPWTLAELHRMAPRDARPPCGCLDCLAFAGKLPCDPLGSEAKDAYARSQAACGNGGADMAWADHYGKNLLSPGESERREKREAAEEAKRTMELRKGDDG